MGRAAAVLALAAAAGPASADPIEAGLSTGTKAAEAIILTGPVGALFVLVVVGLVFALGAAGFVIRALWNTIKERDAATEAMRKEYDTAISTLQEKRAAELVENTKEVARTAISGSAAITASNERLADAAARVQTLAERVLPLPEIVGRIVAAQDNTTRAIGAAQENTARALNDLARACGRGAA